LDIVTKGLSFSCKPQPPDFNRSQLPADRVELIDQALGGTAYEISCIFSWLESHFYHTKL
jgi:hypothetical protein